MSCRLPLSVALGAALAARDHRVFPGRINPSDLNALSSVGAVNTDPLASIVGERHVAVVGQAVAPVLGRDHRVDEVGRHVLGRHHAPELVAPPGEGLAVAVQQPGHLGIQQAGDGAGDGATIAA